MLKRRVAAIAWRVGTNADEQGEKNTTASP
jgi:hypothetical protein